jgi:hypothetical protein
MDKEKTRPKDNSHCFEGLGRQYWGAIARGFTPTGFAQGPEGSRLELDLDTDMKAMQNGGMFNPQETRMPPGIYYRFFGTLAHNRFGERGCMAGGWWIEPEVYFAIRDYAGEQNISIAKAGKAMLVIPDGWHDCGYVGTATLTTKLKAYVGKGKPATSTTSPFNAQRNPVTDPITAPLRGGMPVKQWFVPGNRELLGRFFKMGEVRQVIRA